jgi:excisionase family DNA binding protein
MQRKRVDVLTVKEAAALGRVSEATIRRLIDRGRLRCGRVGRSIRIDVRDVDNLLGKGVSCG